MLEFSFVHFCMYILSLFNLTILFREIHTIQVAVQ